VSPLAPRFFRKLSRAQAAAAATASKSVARVPALLVSVRNALEARAAVAGGCDLLDIKEPERGSLGMADLDVMSAVAQFAGGCRGALAPMACSAALGELIEWQPGTSQFSLPAGIGYVKLGSAGLDSPPKWTEAWRHAQSCFNTAPQGKLQWVAVAYADWRAAGGLPPAAILEAVVAVRCDVFLIDTFDKSAGNLLGLMDRSELRRLSKTAHEAGLMVALAGGLHRAQLPELVEVSPDILGVRGAACAGGRRNAPISAKAVRALKRQVLASFSDELETTSST
jgi:(5-formylfuran-3-yl)methyl phosphate synthase